MLCSHVGCTAHPRTKGLCHKHYNAKWRAENVELVRARQRGKDQRAHNLKCAYGLTIAQWDQILAVQGGVCAICRQVSRSAKPLCVDHDHKTGQVRGLLCQHCNTALGMLEDSPDRLKNALAYLVGPR